MENITIELHSFQKICLKLKDVEDLIEELHTLMETAKVVKSGKEEK